MTDYNEYYDSVERLIEEENKRESDRLISNLAGLFGRNSQGEPEEYNPAAVHARNMVALLCLKIRILFRIQQEGRDCVGLMKDNAALLMSQVGTALFLWRKKEREADTYDLLYVVCDCRRDLVDTIYDWDRRVLRGTISISMYRLLMEIFEIWRGKAEMEDCCALLENICVCSRQYKKPLEHRQIVYDALCRIGDMPDFVCRLAKEEEPCFEAGTDIYTRDFYWFYGTALEITNQNRDALIKFNKCLALTRRHFHENSWYVALVKREIAMLEYVGTGSRSAGDSLLKIMAKIDDGSFDNEVDRKFQLLVKGKTLYSILYYEMDKTKDIELYSRLTDEYSQLCDNYEQFNDPVISPRMMWAFKGICYYERNDYIAAEDAFLRSLDADQRPEVDNVFDPLLCRLDLLMMYYMESDWEKVMSVALELIDDLEDEEKPVGVSRSEIYRVYSIMLDAFIKTGCPMEDEEAAGIKDGMDQVAAIMLAPGYTTVEDDSMAVVFVNMGIRLLMDRNILADEDYEFYISFLDYVERHEDILCPGNIRKMDFHQCKGHLYWSRLDQRAIEQFKKAAYYTEGKEVPDVTKASSYMIYGVFFACNYSPETSGIYINKSLKMLTDIWHQYVRYLNDDRLISTMLPIQQTFDMCYATLREYADIRDAYEILLRFKNLSSLAGRERNRMLRRGSVNPQLSAEIREIQNTLALMETDIAINREQETRMLELENRLRQLENRFAGEFPTDKEFVDISIDRAEAAIPDNSVVAEYYFIQDRIIETYQINSREEDCSYALDIYISIKENGSCRLERVIVSDAAGLAEDAERFLEIMYNISRGQGRGSEIDEMDKLRSSLYDKLIVPVLDYVGDQHTLYIAPDDKLLNLPFDILYGEERIALGDRINCVKIECCRDFLFAGENTYTGEGSLIIGGPRYYSRDIHHDRGGDGLKTAMPEVHRIQPLPFAQAEAYRIAARTGGRAYVGEEAVKSVFLNARGYRVIHIATHGSIEVNEEEESILYRSCLLFAGAGDWFEGSCINGEDNGIVTADEISRMDLSSTELVVLSSCFGGVNDIEWSVGFNCMTGALSAAGVRYVISNLWASDDFASAVLMDAFYDYYYNGHEAPPDALKRAQTYLRTVSVGRLREAGWLNVSAYEGLEERTREYIIRLNECRDRLMPFKQEYYWGGFVCYRCN